MVEDLGMSGFGAGKSADFDYQAFVSFLEWFWKAEDGLRDGEITMVVGKEI